MVASPSSARLSITPVTEAAEWDAARAVRQRVFIEEQACPPEEEWDAYDDVSRHLVGRVGQAIIATARWRTVTHNEEIVAKLERFAVLPAYRGRGYGRALVAYAIRDAEQAGHRTQMLHAQAHLEAFYEDFGFVRDGAPFNEAGIPHVHMTRHPR